MTRRRQVTGRRDDRWRPDAVYFLHSDGISKTWDTDVLIEGGETVARALWQPLRTECWRLWARGRGAGLGPTWQPPAAAATFDFDGQGSTAEHVARFAEAHPRAASAIAGELATWVALVEEHRADLAVLRDARRSPISEPALLAAEPEPDEVDDWPQPDTEPPPGPAQPAPVIPIRRGSRHGTSDIPYR